MTAPTSEHEKDLSFDVDTHWNEQNKHHSIKRNGWFIRWIITEEKIQVPLRFTYKQTHTQLFMAQHGQMGRPLVPREYNFLKRPDRSCSLTSPTEARWSGAAPSRWRLLLVLEALWWSGPCAPAPVPVADRQLCNRNPTTTCTFRTSFVNDFYLHSR